MVLNINPTKGRETERKHQDVEIFFIGVNLMKGVDKKTPPTITLGGYGAKRMPQIGESLIVPANVARIIEKQTMTWHPETNEPIPGITTNREYAATVRAAWLAGKPLAQEVAERASVNLPDDILLKLVKERGLVGHFTPTVSAEEVIEKRKNSDPEVDGDIVLLEESDDSDEPKGEAGLPVTAENTTAPVVKNKAGRPAAKGDK